MIRKTHTLAVVASLVLVTTVLAQSRPVVAIIGTGDMGDSLGPKFAALGYSVVYGSRDPNGDKAPGPDCAQDTRRRCH
jgi:hypothetical protein